MKILLVDDHILFAKSLSIALCDNPEIEQFSSTRIFKIWKNKLPQNYQIFY